MRAASAALRDTSPGAAADSTVVGHGEDQAQAGSLRDTRATVAAPLPDDSIARRLAELAATLRKAGQIAESLSRDAQIHLADARDQSVMDDVAEASRATPAKPEAPALPRLLTVSDLARLLRLDERTVRRRRREGSIPPAIDIGGSLRWRPSEIEAWLDERREGAA